MPRTQLAPGDSAPSAAKPRTTARLAVKAPRLALHLMLQPREQEGKGQREKSVHPRTGPRGSRARRGLLPPSSHSGSTCVVHYTDPSVSAWVASAPACSHQAQATMRAAGHGSSGAETPPLPGSSCCVLASVLVCCWSACTKLLGTGKAQLDSSRKERRGEEPQGKRTKGMGSRASVPSRCQAEGTTLFGWVSDHALPLSGVQGQRAQRGMDPASSRFLPGLTRQQELSQ